METHNSRIATPTQKFSHNRVEVIRLVRLLLESLETAFFLANVYLENYGLSKIFDIVNQIIPTAYVYNTGYWVFYNNQYRQPICVCNRFGIRCPHIRSDRHFVNLNPLVENVENYFRTPIIGKLYPLIANIKVTPVLSDILRAYDAKIVVTVQPLCYRKNKFRLIGNEKSSFSMETRYILTPEHCPLENTIIRFVPSPIVHQAYTSYFQTMERFRAFPTELGYETQIPRTHTIISGDLPRFGWVSNEMYYGPKQSLNPNIPKWQQNNNTVFPGGFSHIWTCPEDHSYNISVRGGCVEQTTIASVSFCKEKFVPITKRKQKVYVPKQKKDEEASSPLQSEQVSSTNEQNFLGAGYENAFPSLPSRSTTVLPKSEENTATSDVTKDNLENAASSSFGDHTYAKCAASPQYEATLAKPSKENIFSRPEMRKKTIKWKKEVFEIKQEANKNIKVNDSYMDLTSPSPTSSPSPPPEKKKTP